MIRGPTGTRRSSRSTMSASPFSRSTPCRRARKLEASRTIRSHRARNRSTKKPCSHAVPGRADPGRPRAEEGEHRLFLQAARLSWYASLSTFFCEMPARGSRSGPARTLWSSSSDRSASAGSPSTVRRPAPRAHRRSEPSGGRPCARPALGHDVRVPECSAFRRRPPESMPDDVVRILLNGVVHRRVEIGAASRRSRLAKPPPTST